MHDDHLHNMLDAWAADERLASRPMPDAIRERVRTARTTRRVSIGVTVSLALVALALIVRWGLPGTDVSLPDPPADPPAATEPISPTVGAIYSMNNGFAGASDEIVLPETPSLQWAQTGAIGR